MRRSLERNRFTLVAISLYVSVRSHILSERSATFRDHALRGVQTSRLEFGMQARGQHRYRPASPVVGDIGDELIVEGRRRPFVDVVRIEGLKNFFRTIIDPSVADQNAEAADCEEIAVIS